MKKTIIKVLDLNATDSYSGRLQHISFFSCNGEISNIIGLNNTEKKLLTDILSGQIELDWRKNRIYINGKQIYRKQQLREQIYVLSHQNYGLDQWSVAKYLSLNEKKGILTPGVIRKMEEDTYSLLETCEIEMDVRMKVCDLDPLERRMLEVLKALKYGASVLLIAEDDFFQDMPAHMIQMFVHFLRRMLREEQTAISLGGTDTTAASFFDFSDQTVVLQQGTIIKKIRKNLLSDSPSMNDLFLKNKKAERRSSVSAESISPVIAGSVFRTCIGEQQFDFQEGELSVFLCQDNQMKNSFYKGISGRTEKPSLKEREIVCYLQGKKLDHDYHSFLNEKIVSLDLIGTKQDIFENFSIEDNLLLPSLEKFSLVEYIQNYRNLKNVISKERKFENILKKKRAVNLNVNDRISLLLERWIIFRPRVLILYEPFLNCDASGALLIQSYIERFLKRNTIVIIIKSNKEYIEKIAHNIFVLS